MTIILFTIASGVYRYGNLKKGSLVSWLTNSMSRSGHSGLKESSEIPENVTLSTVFFVTTRLMPSILNMSRCKLDKVILAPNTLFVGLKNSRIISII